ncbi:MAG: VWA domain-containing protein [Spirochaetales bacterium]|nr:VWA domain-containing protein [Spirochaetales bacterium]
MKKNQLIGLIVFGVIILFIVLANFEDIFQFDPASVDYSKIERMSEGETYNELTRLSNQIGPSTKLVTVGYIDDLSTRKDLVDTLPDISLERNQHYYPLTVDPYIQANDVAVEIFASTEKSGSKDPDNWMTLLAEEYNKRNISLANGKKAKVKLRYIASGTAYLYISTGKYMPQAFTPSSHLWVKMLDASGVKNEVIRDRLVGNIAGVVMRSKIADKLKADYGEVSVANLIDAVIQGDVAMGYTDPFASSTGLNFLITTLSSFADNPDDILSDKVVESFEAFQKGVPYVALSTIQMRDSVTKGGSLDAFVMEYQTYIRAPELKNGYFFLPFGIRHDNPLYSVGDISADQKAVLESFAQFSDSNYGKQLADRYGFNKNLGYKNAYALPSGSNLVKAQSLWKEKKDSGRQIAAIFLCDTSGSMGGEPLALVKKALLGGAEFIDPDNAIGLVAFSSDVYQTLEIKEFNALQKARFNTAVKQLDAGGGTAMYNGILVSLKLLMEYKQDNPDCKPLLFVLTDGDTNEGFEFREAYKSIAGARIPIYTIGYNAVVKNLTALSSINEAASMNASDEGIVYRIGALLNAEM